MFNEITYLLIAPDPTQLN